MTYVPNSLQIFTAALAGAIAGMGASNRLPTDDNSADYVGLTNVAGAFAQSFDTNWGLLPVSLLDVSATQQACEAAWQNRSPIDVVPFDDPNNYTQLSRALISIVKASVSYSLSIGIVPPPVPTAGGGAGGLNGQLQRNFFGTLAGTPGFDYDDFTQLLNITTGLFLGNGVDSGDFIIAGSSGVSTINVISVLDPTFLKQLVFGSDDINDQYTNIYKGFQVILQAGGTPAISIGPGVFGGKISMFREINGGFDGTTNFPIQFESRTITFASANRTLVGNEIQSMYLTLNGVTAGPRDLILPVFSGATYNILNTTADIISAKKLAGIGVPIAPGGHAWVASTGAAGNYQLRG